MLIDQKVEKLRGAPSDQLLAKKLYYNETFNPSEGDTVPCRLFAQEH